MGAGEEQLRRRAAPHWNATSGAAQTNEAVIPVPPGKSFSIRKSLRRLGRAGDDSHGHKVLVR